MDSNDKSFRQNFEILLALFKKLADKMSEGKIQGMNPEFASQFKMMLGQYEMMKHMMPHNIPEQFREPFRQMMENMIHQLKEEVGDDIILTPETTEGKQEKLEKERTIEDIEELLSRPNLRPAEMDKLLDKLTELKKIKG
jgi:hypothetical protein